jgi:hypothetical protein
MSELAGKTRHGLALSIRDHAKNERLATAGARTVDAATSTSLQLNNLVLLESLETRISDSLGGGLGIGVDKVFELVFLLELFIGDEIVKFGQDHGRVGVHLGHPTELPLGSLEVSVRSFQASICLGDLHDAPSHECNSLADCDSVHIDGLQQDLLGNMDNAAAQRGILGMQRRLQMRVLRRLCGEDVWSCSPSTSLPAP